MRHSRIRRWINRDDGRFFRVENHNLRWYQVVGCLSLISAALVLQMNRWGADIASPPGWVAVGLGAAFFAAPWIRNEELSELPNDETDNDNPSSTNTNGTS